MTSLITIGADPELFVVDNGVIVSAIGKLGGTKEEPVPVFGGAVQEDNVLAEFNIDPANTLDEFINNIKSVRAQLNERIYPLTSVVRSSHEFTMQELVRSGRKALMFGCDPDYNAYTGDRNMPPSSMTGLRTAGGHVHVGYPNPTDDQSRIIIRNMDLLLGVPSILLDDDVRRRTMYGAAGCYRIKPYGVEYRTLSNFWLNHTELMSWVYRQSVYAGGLTELIADHDDSIKIVDCINTSSVRAAKELIAKYEVPMP